jgi:menaquinone-dependent protoporphyrinogen IX oxidase
MADQVLVTYGTWCGATQGVAEAVAHRLAHDFRAHLRATATTGRSAAGHQLGEPSDEQEAEKDS